MLRTGCRGAAVMASPSPASSAALRGPLIFAISASAPRPSLSLQLLLESRRFFVPFAPGRDGKSQAAGRTPTGGKLGSAVSNEDWRSAVGDVELPQSVRDKIAANEVRDRLLAEAAAERAARAAVPDGAAFGARAAEGAAFEGSRRPKLMTDGSPNGFGVVACTVIGLATFVVFGAVCVNWNEPVSTRPPGEYDYTTKPPPTQYLVASSIRTDLRDKAGLSIAPALSQTITSAARARLEAAASAPKPSSDEGAAAPFPEFHAAPPPPTTKSADAAPQEDSSPTAAASTTNDKKLLPQQQQPVVAAAATSTDEDDEQRFLRRSEYPAMERAIFSFLQQNPDYEDTGFVSRDEVELTVADRAFTQYGIVTAEGVDTLLRRLQVAASDTFVDIGSGIGNVVLQAAAVAGVHRSVGLELLPSRVAAARTAESQARDMFPAIFREDCEVRWIEGDVIDRTRDLAAAEPTVLFTHSWMFDDALMDALSTAWSTTLPTLRAVATSRPLTGDFADPTLWKHETITLPADWNPEAPFHLYSRTK